ncbi:hypothetical protein AYI70_g7070 [Smittium culicis]|uniref:Uncharacterized protein n=1 Tax=Smittium culicis TaxID=133412 RepID=A0A1R1XM79_9FUNG|nr:hypothetical protein AYI70_g7070 [Smittium culicis]
MLSNFDVQSSDVSDQQFPTSDIDSFTEDKETQTCVYAELVRAARAFTSGSYMDSKEREVFNTLMEFGNINPNLLQAGKTSLKRYTNRCGSILNMLGKKMEIYENKAKLRRKIVETKLMNEGTVSRDKITGNLVIESYGTIKINETDDGINDSDSDSADETEIAASTNDKLGSEKNVDFFACEDYMTHDKSREEEFEDKFLLDFFTMTSREELDEYLMMQEYIISDDGEIDFKFGVSYYLTAFIMRDRVFDNPYFYKIVGGVIESWLRFLYRNRTRLHLADEYEDNLLEAIDVAAKAQVQIPVIYKLSGMFPGTFNRACYDYFYYGDKNRAPLPSQLEGADEESASSVINWSLVSADIEHFKEFYKFQKIVSKRPVDLIILKTFGPGSAFIKVQEYDRSSCGVAHNSEPFMLHFGFAMVNTAEDGQEESDEHIPDLCLRNLIIECTLYSLSNNSKFISDVSSIWPTFAPLDYHLF